MCLAVLRRVAWLWVLVLGASACAQTAESHAPEGSDTAPANQPESPAQGASDTSTSQSAGAKRAQDRSLRERLQAVFSQEDDPDGAINTDRPTFTPANTVVPVKRLQFESGFTFTYQHSGAARSYVYDLPELAMRYGVCDRVEFRMFWLGETIASAPFRRAGALRPAGGLSDMEVGFKWQLFPGDKDRKWIPTTALITSIYAPTGGTSLLSSQTVEPYVNLIYGWNPTDKLSVGGSTGYLGIRAQPAPGSHERADNFQRYHQSLLAFYSVTKRTTLFYEWYAWMFTNALDNRPLYFMDGGLLYHPTPNTQLDIRAGFGLTGRPDEVFTGVGFSVRF